VSIYVWRALTLATGTGTFSQNAEITSAATAMEITLLASGRAVHSANVWRDESSVFKATGGPEIKPVYRVTYRFLAEN
jgi:hypothetical protein